MYVHHLRTLLVVCLFGAPLSARAGKCEKETQVAAREACERKKSQRARKHTTPFLPSALAPGFKRLDAQNPLESDDWYVGLPKRTGVDSVDQIARSVTRLEAAITLARYTGDLHTNGHTRRSTRLAKELLPVLRDLSSDVSSLSNAVTEIAADPLKLVTDRPLAVVSVTRVTVGLGRKMPRLVRELPKVTTALAPIAETTVQGAARQAASTEVTPDP